MDKKGAAVIILGAVLAATVTVVILSVLSANDNIIADSAPVGNSTGTMNAISGSDDSPDDAGKDSDPGLADVVMPTKSSRPGCELADRCYIPSEISIDAGESVSWLNDDAAFHSVTSGTYGDPTLLFDSGYMDPEDLFTYTFEEPGVYSYYCTLHEWMVGTVIVN